MNGFVFFLTIILTNPTVEQINDIFHLYRDQPVEIICIESISVPPNVILRGMNKGHVLMPRGGFHDSAIRRDSVGDR